MVRGVGGLGWWRCGRRRVLIVESVECRWWRRGCRVSQSCWAVGSGAGWRGDPGWYRVSVFTVCAWWEAVVFTGVL